MLSKKQAVGGAIAACALCCAPLVVPLVWPLLVGASLSGVGAAGAGWLAGFGVGEVICVGVAVTAAAGWALWRRRRLMQSAVPVLISEEASCDLETCNPGTRNGPA